MKNFFSLCEYCSRLQNVNTRFRIVFRSFSRVRFSLETKKVNFTMPLTIKRSPRTWRRSDSDRCRESRVFVHESIPHFYLGLYVDDLILVCESVEIKDYVIRKTSDFWLEFVHEAVFHNCCLGFLHPPVFRWARLFSNHYLSIMPRSASTLTSTVRTHSLELTLSQKKAQKPIKEWLTLNQSQENLIFGTWPMANSFKTTALCSTSVFRSKVICSWCC